jgi:uncharacterized protein (DUF58 family)
MKNMLTNEVWELLESFSTLFLIGIFFGNLPLLCLSLIPLFALFIALHFEEPNRVRVERAENKVSASVNGTAELKMKIEVEHGVGLVTVIDRHPKQLELIEGNNLRVFWKGFSKLSEAVVYKLKCTERGVYRIGPVQVESQHAVGLRQTKVQQYPAEAELSALVKPLSVERIRDAKVLSKIPMPSSASAKLGMLTTDFKEIREYRWGDPYGQINWKATARLASSAHAPPYINDFEREGKRVVWIFLDASQHMRLGTAIENTLKYATQAVLRIAHFYIARNCQVTLYVYNDGGRLLLPDSGRRQEYRVLREIFRVESEKSVAHEPLQKAVEKCLGHTKGTNPYFIIVTNLNQENFNEVLNGVKQLRKISKETRNRPQILIIHVSTYSVVATGPYEKAAAAMLEMKNNTLFSLLRRSGAHVVMWNPKRQSFSFLLLAGLTQT